MSPRSRLLTWMRRARPTNGALARAMGSSVATHLAGTALFVGAPYLLVLSAAPGRVVTAGSLAIVLVVIELLAFLRSPLRYAERLSTHELGLAAVTQWRRWLLVTVGRWPYRRWRAAADGDLLERALTDTDELQDLWVRSVVPGAAAVVATLVAIGVAGAFPAGLVRLGWACVALALVLVVGVLAVSLFLAPLVDAERGVKVARAARTASLVDAHSFAAEVTLLGRRAYVQEQLDQVTAVVAGRERHRDNVVRSLQATAVAIPLVGLVFVSWVANLSRPAFGRTDLIVLLLGVVVFETTVGLRAAIEVAARVVIATERLDDLATNEPSASRPWPTDATVVAHALVVRHDDTAVLDGVDLTLPPGSRVAVTGPVGSGKSTLLRVLAGLDTLDEGTIVVGGEDLATVAETALRAHLGYVSAAPRLTSGVASRVLRAGRDIEVDVAATMATFGITADAGTRWPPLSRGEAMRVALARQLASGPDVLVLDEPTSGLGPDERALVLDRLASFGGTLVCATHDADLIATCSTELALAHGRPRASATPL